MPSLSSKIVLTATLIVYHSPPESLAAKVRNGISLFTVSAPEASPPTGSSGCVISFGLHAVIERAIASAKNTPTALVRFFIVSPHLSFVSCLIVVIGFIRENIVIRSSGSPPAPRRLLDRPEHRQETSQSQEQQKAPPSLPHTFWPPFPRVS